MSKVDVSMNGIELQDREFFAAIREGREPNASVAQVLPCYEVLRPARAAARGCWLTHARRGDRTTTEFRCSMNTRRIGTARLPRSASAA